MFAELVCGPPGCGKTTYCEGKRQFLEVYDPTRPVVMVNMDPANDGIFPYPCDVDIRELVSLDLVAREEHLGPNGSYLYCAELIATHISEVTRMIHDRIREKVVETPGASSRAPFLICDLPGQVEFYLHSEVIHAFTQALQKTLRCSVCLTHLLDASVVTRSVSSYVSGCLLVLNVMTSYELPQVNLLSKWDLVDGDEAAAFMNVSSVVDSFLLLAKQEAALPDKLRSFGLAALQVVEGYSIVGFRPLSVQEQDSMLEVTREIDNALGNFV